MQSHLSDLTGLKAELKAQRAALRQAASEHNEPATAESIAALNTLVERIAERVKRDSLSLTAAEFDASIMGAMRVTPDPAIEEAADILLTLIGNGLATFCSAMRFKSWCRTADLSGSVSQIRQRFFSDRPADYVTTTVCRRILGILGIERE
jgi:hypothetical protein